MNVSVSYCGPPLSQSFRESYEDTRRVFLVGNFVMRKSLCTYHMIWNYHRCYAIPRWVRPSSVECIHIKERIIRRFYAFAFGDSTEPFIHDHLQHLYSRIYSLCSLHWYETRCFFLIHSNDRFPSGISSSKRFSFEANIIATWWLLTINLCDPFWIFRGTFLWVKHSAQSPTNSNYRN